MLAATRGFTLADPAGLAVLAVGVIVLIGIAARVRQDGRAWSPGLVYAGLGLLVALGVHVVGVEYIDPIEDAAVLEHLTEIAVVVTLFGTGLRIDRRLGRREWRSVVALLGVLLPLTVAAVALLGMGLLGLSLGAAVVLGACVAPTDPVLAGDVGVGGPGEGEEAEPRFALTAEAALNDGLAFPFLIAGLAIAQDGGTGWIGSWFAIDVVVKLAIGIVVGAIGGHLLARLLIPPHQEGKLEGQLDGWMAVACALVLYGAAQVLGGYGFLAAIAGGLAFRRFDAGHESQHAVHAGAERFEKLFELAAIVLVMSTVTLAGLQAPGVAGWLLALLLVVVVRPAVTLPLLRLWRIEEPAERRFIAWFGVRGLGSIYYVAIAIGSGVMAEGEESVVLWTVVACVLVSLVVHGATASAATRALERAVPVT